MPDCSEVFLSEKEAATYLGGISLSTLRRLRRNGRGPEYIRFGDILRYRREALDAFLARNTVSPPVSPKAAA
jgi:excisionase family DNA binding protein